jgi:Flp pilus assembly protein TadB
MNGFVVLGCLAAGGAAGNSAWLLVHPLRPPERWTAPYLEVARSRLAGTSSFPEPVFFPEAARRVLGPLAHSVVSRFTRAVRTRSPANLALQLRQAGATFDVHAYRRANLLWVGVLPVGLALIGVLTGSTFVALGLLVVGIPLGSRRMPAHLRSLRRRRAARVRSDLPTIAVMLATKIANTKSLLVALREVTQTGRSPVIEDFKRVLLLVDSGFGARAALELASVEAVDPAAARTYRLIAQATTGGIELGPALIDLAGELRSQRREEVERAASRRQLAMTGPIVAFTVPVIALFIIVPTTSLLAR